MEPAGEATAQVESDEELEGGPGPRSGRFVAFLVRWLRRLAIVVGLVSVTAIGAVFALLWPYVRDDLVLDRVVLAVALDWRDFGQEKAQARLEYELDHQAIGLQVSDEDCVLHAADAGVRRVSCAWTALVAVPVLEWTVPLPFRSVAEVGPDGSLR